MATPNHPSYLPRLGRYIPADSLRQGMQLLALTGALLTVQSVAALDTTVHVYNFEVAATIIILWGGL
ncbi:MAG: polymorphic toxin-type HINT domain-containing protein [Saprospiraceae bacterium]